MFLVTLLRSYLDWILSLLQMNDLFFFAFYTTLLYDNFHITEWLYTFMVEEGFNRSSEHIEMAIGLVQGYINKNWSGVISFVKLTLSSIVVQLLGYMPDSVQPILNMLFSGVKKYQAEAKAAYETQTETESESPSLNKSNSLNTSEP